LKTSQIFCQIGHLPITILTENIYQCQYVAAKLSQIKKSTWDNQMFSDTGPIFQVRIKNPEFEFLLQSDQHDV
jgi:hypothetical protein